MALAFKKATRTQSKLRLGLVGPSGSGKTYTALRLAHGLGGRIAVIDSERGSASKYAGEVCEFDVLELESFAPLTYVQAIKAAEAAGYDVIVIDSLSHAWMGKDGALEQVDNASKRSQSKNSYHAWREVTPQHNAMVDAILQSRCHVIVTLRAKTEYVTEQDARGKAVPRKIGLAPIQRDGMEYEFDLLADIDLDHNFMVSKTRCKQLDKKVFPYAGEEDVAAILRQWLSDGAPAPEREEPAPERILRMLARVTSVDALGELVVEAGNEWPGFTRDQKIAWKTAYPEVITRVREAEEAERALGGQGEGEDLPFDSAPSGPASSPSHESSPRTSNASESSTMAGEQRGVA